MSYIQILYAVVLLANVLIIGTLMWRAKRRKGRNDNKNDDDNGGIEINKEPVLDLPPGVTLPINSPPLKKEPVSV